MDLLIRQFEGCKLQAYKCPAGVWTIGWGNTTYPDGKPVKENDFITQEYADALLTDYLMKNVVPYLSAIKYPITLNQKRALCSLIYNVGWTKVSKSKLWKAILNKDYVEIFRQWDFGSSQAKGLAKRRSCELYNFMNDL